MAKQVSALVKLQVKGGAANPSPPVGPALGAKGVNIMEFCKQFNARTQDKPGKVLPVVITVYADKSFDFIIKTPPVAIQLIEATGLKGGSGEPNRKKVGSVTWEQVETIAKDKMTDLNAFTVDSAMKMVAGTARSMGITVSGDAPFNNPSYQYHVAKKIAEENSNVVAVGMLRPGYKDNEGNRSEGERGKTTGDNYTRDVLAAINNVAAELKEQYNPSKIILVGHSGGAAISANLLAEYPHFYAGAVLVACPCDLHEWRAHMKALRPRARIWNKEVNSLSPIEEVERMDDSAQIIVLHGDNDEVVPIDIAKSYVAELEANNKQVNLILLENQGHEIAFDQKVFEAVKILVE